MRTAGRTLVTALAVCLGCIVPALSLRQASRIVCTFSETTEGWLAVPPPSGVPMEVALTPGPPSGRSLCATYKLEPRKLAGLMRLVSGAVGSGLKLRLKTDSPTTVVIGCIERDGSSYVHIVQTGGGAWLHVSAPFVTFALSEDSRDENGRLDLDQIGTLVIADAAGFMPVAPASRTLWLDDVDFGAEVRSAPEQPYRPLLAQGPRSPSGATVTAGVTYVTGKHGRAMLADSPGELGTIRVADSTRFARWRWEQGSLEMWLSPTQPLSSVADFSGIAAMQQEPFIVGHRGGLALFVTKGSQIAFMLNGATDRLATTGPLDWTPGSWHHLAVTWGPQGMRAYADGGARGRNGFAGGPALPASDLVIGNHAWTILSHRPARLAVDDVRVSVRQRTDAEVAAAARSTTPARADTDTLALERFDGSPAPPVALIGGSQPWNSFVLGETVELAVRPAAPSGTRAIVTLPDGRLVRAGAVRDGGRRLNLGRFTEMGFYRVTLGSAGAGWFRVVRRGQRRGAEILGASACFAEAQENEAFFRLARAAGVRMLRMPFEWYEIEPVEGRFTWAKYDRIVGWAQRYGVGLIPTFIWEKPQPAWAGPGEARPGLSSERWPPTDMGRWKRFVGAVVGRYKGAVRWWIPANEPNLPRYWHPRPDAKAYVALLRATREAAKAADPQARILGLSASGIDLRFMEDCFREGALDHCDAVGIHPYICPHSPDERIPVNILDPGSRPGTFLEGLRAAGELIRRHGGKHRLWLDEAGQPYRNDFIAPNWGRPESEAAAILSKEVVEALASGVVDRALWFSFYGGEYGSFALVRPDSSPTLPLAAYCAAGEMLAGARFAGNGSRAGGTTSRRFRGPSGAVEAVWRPSGRAQVRLASHEVAYDLYGFRIAPSGRTISVGSDPVYIISR